VHLASPTLARAALEYRWLIDRGYATSAGLKLVGDKHQMTRDERMILFRGVASSRASEARLAVIAAPDSIGAGLEILVDGYNQALTVMHYLAGRLLFIGTDGLTRDAGAAHGRIADQALFERAIGLLADRLAAPSPERVAVYLDAPVPGSAGHAALFRRLFAARGLEAIVLLERSADAPLKAAGAFPSAPPGGPSGGPSGGLPGGPPGEGARILVATSDSAIAEALAASAAAAADAPTAAGSPARRGARIYDAARWAIEQAFGPTDILDLGRLLETANEAL
jgi:hypothetical protein